MHGNDFPLCYTSCASMQVARKVLTREPYFIARSIDYVKHRLQSIQQLTDPPLDLDTALQKANLLRSGPASQVQMAQWLRTNLQLSDEDLRGYLSKHPGILRRSSVSRSITKYAQTDCHDWFVEAASYAASFDIWGLLWRHSYPASGLNPCMLKLTETPEVDMVAGDYVQKNGGIH